MIRHTRCSGIASTGHSCGRFLILVGVVLIGSQNFAATTEPLYFDVNEGDTPTSDTPSIEPWKTIRLEPDYGGLWVVAGDLDGDGSPEIVSAENFNQGDVHYTSAVVAQNLEGEVLWTWGTPDVGRKKWHHDVACQIYDWDGDGRQEVIVCDRTSVVELDGSTGKEKRRFTIPKEATDCLVFCNLEGDDHPSELLVKDRYHHIHAYDHAGQLLWEVTDPGGYPTAHQPRPIDLDGDGRDEIIAGFSVLNADGSLRWTFASDQVDLHRGHLDCARLLQHGEDPAEIRIALTCCGANNVAVVDGNGKLCWERSGHHFESLQVGQLHPDHPGPHILVDIDHMPKGKSPLWILDAQGRQLGQIITSYGRHHRLVDWTGDGISEFVVGGSQGLYDYRGKRIGHFTMPASLPLEKRSYETSVLVGDMTGDGVPDILFVTPDHVMIYKNQEGRKPDGPSSVGTGVNFTLY